MIAPNEGSATEIPFTLKPGGKQPPKCQPYGHILQLDWTPEKMIGGIHLPENMKKMPFYSVKVIAVGPECKLVKEGDNVLLPAQMIQEATWDGNRAFFTGENQILCVVKD
jgi:co-chaperonin GroES (HSP10)